MNSEPGSLKHFMVVDDDPVNNMVCKYVISKVFSGADIKMFTEPEKALELIIQEYSSDNDKFSVTLFLDINMPAMTGWEFLDEFKSLREEVRKNFAVYILSSTVDAADKDRAQENPLISGFLSKPLTVENLQQLGAE